MSRELTNDEWGEMFDEERKPFLDDSGEDDDLPEHDRFDDVDEY
jgi:hypothetical protein